ncbi:MAG: ADOP family duplicated permease [Gemmatimonadales bacterium]
MTLLRRLRRRARALFSKPDVDREMSDEIRLHLALEAEELIRTGLPHDEAVRRAHVAFGGVERHKEETRDARGVRRIEDAARDITYILRSLRRAPAFAVAVVLSLALGIGANSTMFTIINAVLLRPLPYPHAGELLGVMSSSKGVVQDGLHEPYYQDWARASRTVSAIALYVPTNATIAGMAAPELVSGTRASSTLFEVLQTPPRLGRLFTRDDEASNAPPVVVLGDALWRRHFGADSTIIGKTITVSDKPVTVIGVMPPGFAFPLRAEFWAPWQAATPATTARGIYFVRVVARPQADATATQIQRELSALALETDRGLPASVRGSQFVVVPLHDEFFGSARPALRLLFAAVLLLLLIACANVANLAFARTIRRQREFAVRMTLGATRATLVWLVVAENTILACAGGAVGLVISYWVTGLFVRLSPPSISRVANIAPDGMVIAFTAVLAVSTALLVGVGPALRAARRDPRAALGEGGAREGAGRFAARVRFALVTGQLATAVVLLTGAGLFIRSLVRLTTVDLGFRPDHVLVVDLPLPRARYAGGGAQGRALFDQLTRRMRGVPGVTNVAYGVPPLQGYMSWRDLAATPSHQATKLAEADVGANFFNTFGVSVLEGRGIVASDDSARAPVVVINSSAARIFFPSGGAVGRQFDEVTVGDRHPTVVGVVADFPQEDVAIAATPEAFHASAQDGGSPFTIAIRTSGDPVALTPFVRAAVHELDPALALGSVTTMDKVVAGSTASTRFASLLLGAFAGLAVILAALGLYGVISYGVAQRSRELGIRAALGATGPMLMRLVASEMMWVIGLGLSIGIGGAWMLARLTQALLFGTTVHDPLTFVLVPVALVVPAAIATLVPARKAMRVNPLDVIQAE